MTADKPFEWQNMWEHVKQICFNIVIAIMELDEVEESESIMEEE